MEDIRFKVLENATDFVIKSYGACLEQLFANTAYGMFTMHQGKVLTSGMSDTKKAEQIAIKSANREELLVEFLNELLYLAEIKKRSYGAFSFIKLTEKELVAIAYYTPLSKPKIPIKAAIYHNLKIKKSRNYYEATVTFDI